MLPINNNNYYLGRFTFVFHSLKSNIIVVDRILIIIILVLRLFIMRLAYI